jgi:nitrogen fixation protein NifX
MAKHALAPELALRIGLAAKALPGSDIRHLMAVLVDTVGLPLTVSKLESLQLKDLKQNFRAEFEDIDDAALERIGHCLRGEIERGSIQEVPQPEPYLDETLPGSVRVACASNQGERIDGHFGSCARFLIYEVSPEEFRLIDVRSASEVQSTDEKNSHRAEMIRDCDLLYVNSIGGPAAAKVIKAGLLPIKQPQETDAINILVELQQRLAGDPPPWLAKVMGAKAKDRIRFHFDDNAAMEENEL